MPTYDTLRLDRVWCAAFERRGMRRASALTSCSNFLAREAAEKLSELRPIEVIPNGIDLELLDDGDQIDVRERLGIPASRPIVLF